MNTDLIDRLRVMASRYPIGLPLSQLLGEAASALAARDGWVLVPKVATREMKASVDRRRYAYEHGGSAGSYDAYCYYDTSRAPYFDPNKGDWDNEWNAWLSAAPQPTGAEK